MLPLLELKLVIDLRISMLWWRPYDSHQGIVLIFLLFNVGV